MPRPRPIRRLALATGLLVLLAAPGVAHAQTEPDTDPRVAPHQHDLIFDKQEIFKTVPAGGAYRTYTADCGSGSFVLSGSIRVDVVNGGLLTDVDVRKSVPQGTSGPTSWLYEIANNAPAGQQDAQIKLMISCVKGTTQGGDGDQHALTFMPRVESALSVPSFAPYELQKTLQCDSSGQSFGSIPVGAGATINPGTAARRLIGMEPSVGLYGGKWFPASSETFTAGADGSQAAMTLTPTLWCLSHYTGRSSERTYAHSHYIDATLQTLSFQVPRGSSPYSQAVFCPSGSYGVSPMFYVPFTAVSRGLRLVGIGYQGDQDVFKFVNPNGAADVVDIGVLCVGRKTSATTKPTAGAGPGAQKLLTTERTVPLRIAPRATAKVVAGCRTKSDFVTAGSFSGTGAASVVVLRSGGGGDPTRWPFALRNASSRAVSLSLHVKCLAPWAEGHTLSLRGSHASTPDGVDGCGTGAIAIRPTAVLDDRFVSCLNRRTTVRINHFHELITTTVTGVVRGPGTRTLRCAAGSAALVPAATLTPGQRLVGSVPVGRAWRFAVAGGGVARLSVTCLRNGTTPEDVTAVRSPVVPEA